MDGIRMHARVSVNSVPAGQIPVVLVHGLGMSSRYMVPLARRLAADVPIYAPDLPGFGLSDKPRRVLTVPGMADALAAWMDSMEIGRAALVGNSLGCEVLVELAVRHPDRVERLVLQGPTPDPEQASALRQVMLFCVTGLFERWSLGWIALADYLRGGVWRYIQTFRHMQAYRVDEALPRIAVPVLVVRGSRDFLVPQAWADRIVHRLSAGRLVVVPGAAHGMNYSHSRQLRNAILPFLLGRDDGAPIAGRDDAAA